MKHLKSIGLAIVIMLLVIPISARADGLGDARLSLIDGDVQIRSEDSSEWFPASVNMPLRDSDSIWVPEGGRAEIQLVGGTQVRLDELSSIDILNIGRDSSQFYLAEGSSYVNVRGGRSGSLVQIDTPVSSVRVYDRAAFNVDVAGNGNTDISVYNGQVYAESRNGSTRVTAGNVLQISDDYADLLALGRPDSWERWNADRDRRFEERRYSSRYLPDELDVYASDFDDNGRWISVGDYGYVWTPTVQISLGWSPYRNGRWCWIGGDYVWVGYEPWGWAPYHYGRWAFAASVGWFWVPPSRGDVYWGPGYVGWVWTPTYVAWVPLAPREIYYGHGHYGRYSKNVINLNINTVSVKHSYKNVHVANGVTVQHHDTFTKGRKVDFKMHDNPFLREKISIGRPDIKAERESRMAVVRDIPWSKEPPRKIREIRVREIRETRPMVRERDRSVFSPGSSGKQMRVQAFDAPRERKRESLGERVTDHNRRVIGSERPRVEERGREIMPQDHQEMMRKEKESGISNRAPIVQPQQNRQMRQPEPPRREVMPPESMKRREIRTPDQGVSNQPMPGQREIAPVQNRQMRQPEPPRREVMPPESMKRREIRTPDQGVNNQPMPGQREIAPVQNRQMRQPEPPRREVMPPESMKRREIRTPDQGVSNQPMPGQREIAPVQNRQIQREERQLKQPVIQNTQKDRQESLKKSKEEADRAKSAGEGVQGSPWQGGPVRR